MARRNHVIVRVILGAVLMAAATAAPLQADAEEKVTLKGEIEVAESDHDGTVLSVAIYDDEWGSVLILSTGQGKALLGHAGKVATVSGTLVEPDEDSGYSHAIRVSSYVLDESDEKDDDEHDPGDEPDSES